MQMSHVSKTVATGLGVALCGVEVWLNAEHIAHAEGWASSLVAATVVASVSAAASLPLAERAVQAGQSGKAALLTLFFLLMVGFSLSASISRTGGKVDSDIDAVRAGNARAELLRDAYETAKQEAEAECADAPGKPKGSGRGPKCEAKENTRDAAFAALSAAPVAKAVENSMAARIAATLPVTEDQVRLYQPLILPLAFQIGGFILLALGLAPGRPEPDVWAEPPAKEAEPVRITTQAEAYRWLIGEIHRAPKRQLDRSGRSIADQLGIPPSTFAKWVERWVAEGKIAKAQSGNSTVWSLPKIRRVA